MCFLLPRLTREPVEHFYGAKIAWILFSTNLKFVDYDKNWYVNLQQCI